MMFIHTKIKVRDVVQMITGFFIITMLLLSPSIDAASEHPCKSKDAYQQFDFWLGNWKVYDSKGIFQGSNRIEKSTTGCLIKESWTSAKGGEGFSTNYYNPVSKKWAQHWVSAGSIIDYTGGLVNDSMFLEGTIYYQATNKQTPFRGTWTLLKDGRVRQLFEQYDTLKDKWTVWFDGYYEKQDVTEVSVKKSKYHSAAT